MIDELPVELIHIICDYLYVYGIDNVNVRCRLVCFISTSKRYRDIVHNTDSYVLVRSSTTRRLVCYHKGIRCFLHLLCTCYTSDLWVKNKIAQGNILRYIKYYYKFNNFSQSDLGFVCKHDYIDAAKWMHKTFTLTSADIPDDLLSSVLQSNFFKHPTRVQAGCEEKELEMAKWLYTTFDVSTPGRDALHIACASNRLKIAKWLHSTFNVTAYVRHNNIHTLELTCEFGYLDMTKWLHTTFNLTKEDVCCCGNVVLRQTLSNNHLDVAQWLNDTFDIIPTARGTKVPL